MLGMNWLPHCALPLQSLHEGPDARRWQAWSRCFLDLYALDPQAIRVRNPEGCGKCDCPELPNLRGISGRTVVAEMIEPAHDEVFLDCLRKRDNLHLRRHLDAQRSTSFNDADMRGKSAMDCAIYKASIGQIDPRDIEPRFRAFETVALERGMKMVDFRD